MVLNNWFVRIHLQCLKSWYCCCIVNASAYALELFLADTTTCIQTSYVFSCVLQAAQDWKWNPRKLAPYSILLINVAIFCKVYVHRCSSLSPFLPLPSFVDRFLVCPPPQSWQTGTGFVTTSSYCQPKHPLHLPTSVSFGTMGGGGWGLLCRMRTSSQWYEVNRRPAICLFSQGWYSVFISLFHCPLSLATTKKTFGLLEPYFGPLSCIPIVYVAHYKFNKCLQFESKCSWKVSPFCWIRIFLQNAYKSAFLVRLGVHICHWRSFCTAYLC